MDLELVEDKRDRAALQLAAYRKRMVWSYNKKYDHNILS